ncbi:MAG: hypothetical protein ACFE96_01390 [Candidatus Hermodarchaeota archaeon]
MSKKKIFYALSVFLLFGMTISVLNATAHAPVNVHMEYDVDTEKLDVIYTHGISDPEVHYIQSIEVWVNETQVWEYHDHFYYSDSVPGKGENYAHAIPPNSSVAPDYTFVFDEQETQITEITVSHTLVRYILDIPGLQKTGDPVVITDPYTEEQIEYLGRGRTNITLRANCSLGGYLAEHYYVGLPYYNPHLTFAEAAMPATVSTIIVFALLFILPKLGQKNAPKLKKEEYESN